MSGALVQLGTQHAAALENFLTEFDSAREELHGYFCARDMPIEQAVSTLADWGAGRDISDGWVPCSTWFWEEGAELRGVINIRHRLIPKLERVGGHIGYSVARSHRQQGVATRMLAAALEKCRELGILRALLTCDSGNEASRKTIEFNGGKLERESWLEEEQREQRWYWIDLEG
ncbi:MAG: putative acetyltransferase [Candidatus Paceibacteria bacterium]|jgi:predicted acetyltransferase